MAMPEHLGGLGLRDMELFNLAFLARQAWRNLENLETLSATILKAMYYPSDDFLEVRLGSQPSQIWRAMVEGRNILELGLIRKIGDGRTMRIWQDNWLPRDVRLRPYA
jgi:hypothetical protein